VKIETINERFDDKVRIKVEPIDELKHSMAKNNYLDSNKIILVGWMDKILDQTMNKRTFI